MSKMLKPDKIDASINLGPMDVSGTWEPHEEEKKASWELYIELVTRISVQELDADKGLLREALSSIYSLFGITREILKKYGPIVGTPKQDGNICLGFLAISILNYSLRPFLSKWHPLLQDYEDTRKLEVSRFEHEKRWEKNKELREDLKKIQEILGNYASLLAEVAKVPPIHKMQK
ncbi:MAG: hypothetical protein ACTSW1_03060 [Candidatus Hodarchaeales archaeon]